MATETPHCPNCKGSTFRHMHDGAHGMAETHMSGTERFECVQCGHNVYKRDNVPNFVFILDK